jgi:hypothetical protein
VGRIPFFVYLIPVDLLCYPAMLHQKYDETHKSIIGGDINEDWNEPRSAKRNLYMRDFINECCLKYDNMAKTFVNSLGQESLEIDYFLHNFTLFCR